MAQRRSDRIVDFYRPMAKRALAVPLAIGAVLMTIGGLLVLLSLPRATAVPMLAILGGACMISAPVSVILALLRGAGVDRCLILRRDAIVIQEGREETLVAWEDVREIRCIEDWIEITRRDGSKLRIEGTYSEPTRIAERMEEVRRKACFGLI
jgi:hypothetical protein